MSCLEFREKFSTIGLKRSKPVLIQFQVENFRSFRERATFSMLASKLSSRDPSLDSNTIFEPRPDLRLLTSAAVYGANASGKSNLIKAIAFMRWFVLNSNRSLQSGEMIPIDPFRLSDPPTHTPSFFEITFVVGDVEYRFGFEADDQHVAVEWLYARRANRERTLFEREGRDIHLGPDFRKEGHGVGEKTRDNALFLSTVAQFNGPTATAVVRWFQSLRIMSGLDDLGARIQTVAALHDPVERAAAVTLLRGFDLGIESIEIESGGLAERFPSSLPAELRVALEKYARAVDDDRVKTVRHALFADGRPGRAVTFDLEDESEGTQKIFALTSPLRDALRHGWPLIIDEFDARLHPVLSHAIIRLFNSRDSNPRHAQLIVATHDTSILNKSTFRRDQIWFTEKDSRAGTDLYSLAEYKVRNDASFDKDYMMGRYGSIPFVRNVNNIIEDISTPASGIEPERTHHGKKKRA